MDLCVVRGTGAVMFGVDPTVVGVRRSRLTYGVGVLHRFVPGRHPATKRISRDGAAWCRDVFDRFVAVDQEVSDQSRSITGGDGRVRENRAKLSEQSQRL